MEEGAVSREVVVNMRGVEDDMEDDHEGLEPAVGDGGESEEPEEDGTRRHDPSS